MGDSQSSNAPSPINQQYDQDHTTGMEQHQNEVEQMRLNLAKYIDINVAFLNAKGASHL